MNTDELIFLTKSEAIKDVMNVIVVFMWWWVNVFPEKYFGLSLEREVEFSLDI